MTRQAIPPSRRTAILAAVVVLVMVTGVVLVRFAQRPTSDPGRRASTSGTASMMMSALAT